MRGIVLCLLLVTFTDARLFGRAKADPRPTASEVVVASSSQFLYDGTEASKYVQEVFDGTLPARSNTDRVINFYSPYCGHCRNFKKPFTNIAKATQRKYTVDFLAVSCVGTKYCREYSIDLYPTVLAVPAGESVADGKTVKTMMFGVKRIEKALDLQKKKKKKSAQETELDAPHDEEALIHALRHDTADSTMGKPEDISEGPSEDGGMEHPSNVSEEGEEEEDEEHSEKQGDTKEEGEEEDSEDEDTPIRAGADAVQHQEKSMNKWQEVARQRIREQEYRWMKHHKARPGDIGHRFINEATEIMKGNRRGTGEYNARQKALIEVLKRMEKSKPKHVELVQKVNDGQRAFHKGVAKPSMIEKIPVFKHAHRMSNEEALILDASLSFIKGLSAGVYRSSADPLDRNKKKALTDWLQLVTVALPQEWGLHATIDDLLSNIDDISRGPEALNRVLYRRPMHRTEWSRSCNRTDPFSCGLWKLLHIITVGIAEHRGGKDLVANGSVRSDTRVFSPLDAADTIREYVGFFFLCTECANHFIAQYDQCDVNRRCDRLARDVDDASNADWKEPAKWLWEFHNGVSVRLLNERHDLARKAKQQKIILKAPAGPGAAPLKDEVAVLWPQIEDCITCFESDGRWSEEGVFRYLEETYWPGHDLKDTPRRLIWLEDDGEGALGLNFILLVVGMILVAVTRQKVLKASVKRTMVRARTLGNKVAHGKLRVV